MFIPEEGVVCRPGTDVCRDIQSRMGPEREKELLYHYLDNLNIPSFIRNFVSIDLVDGDDRITINVSPDYLSIGTDLDYVRTPMGPITAQKIADRWNCILPTKKIVDAIWSAAQVKLNPFPLPPTNQMTTKEWFLKSNFAIEGQLSSTPGYKLGKLVAGHKKDIIITHRTNENSSKVVIYGWHMKNGVPIQNVNAKSHDSAYSDYSHGVRLVSKRCVLNGAEANIEDVMKDKFLSRLVSDERIEFPRYNAEGR